MREYRERMQGVLGTISNGEAESKGPSRLECLVLVLAQWFRRQWPESLGRLDLSTSQTGHIARDERRERGVGCHACDSIDTRLSVERPPEHAHVNCRGK